MAERVPQWSALPSACAVWPCSEKAARGGKLQGFQRQWGKIIFLTVISLSYSCLGWLEEDLNSQISTLTHYHRNQEVTKILCQDQMNVNVPSCNQYMMNQGGYLLKCCLVQMVIWLFTDFWACRKLCNVLSSRLEKHSTANVLTWSSKGCRVPLAILLDWFLAAEQSVMSHLFMYRINMLLKG